MMCKKAFRKVQSLRKAQNRSLSHLITVTIFSRIYTLDCCVSVIMNYILSAFIVTLFYSINFSVVCNKTFLYHNKSQCRLGIQPLFGDEPVSSPPPSSRENVGSSPNSGWLPSLIPMSTVLYFKNYKGSFQVVPSGCRILCFTSVNKSQCRRVLPFDKHNSCRVT